MEHSLEILLLFFVTVIITALAYALYRHMTFVKLVQHGYKPVFTYRRYKSILAAQDEGYYEWEFETERGDRLCLAEANERMKIEKRNERLKL